MKVIVTGANGQDGAFLCRDLVQRGLEVIACVRRGSTPKTDRLTNIGVLDKIKIVSVDISDFASVFSLIKEYKPKQIFNLAAQSFVHDSFINPMVTSKINYDSVLNMLEAIKIQGINCSLYQASTSEMYGEVVVTPQNEETPFNPLSPYAVSKCAAHQLVKIYRTSFGMPCASGILFNHESEFRGREFVTRKITSGLAEMKLGREMPIDLGNCGSVRDWGYAPEYVAAMQLINDAKIKCDYVVATNQITTVREFFLMAAEAAGFEPVIEGEDINEKCIDKKTGKILYKINPDHFRPSDVCFLRGDYSKINKDLGWKPKTNVNGLCKLMIEHDIKIISN